MTKNTHSTTPVPTSEPRPYSELETRLIALLENLSDDYRNFQVEISDFSPKLSAQLIEDGGSDAQAAAVNELAKHPSQQEMVKNLPAYREQVWDCLKNPDGKTTVTKAQVFDHEGNPVD